MLMGTVSKNTDIKLGVNEHHKVPVNTTLVYFAFQVDLVINVISNRIRSSPFYFAIICKATS